MAAPGFHRYALVFGRFIVTDPVVAVLIAAVMADPSPFERTGDDPDRAILDRGIVQRQPHRQVLSGGDVAVAGVLVPGE